MTNTRLSSLSGVSLRDSRRYRPGLLGRDYVLPRAAGLKGVYLDCFGLPDVRLQLSSLYLYETLSLLRFQTLLDIGCGSGNMTNLLAAAHPQSRFFGIDRDAQGIDYARRIAEQNGLQNVQFQATDAEQGVPEFTDPNNPIPGGRFPESGFDVITCIGVLQFIEDIGGLLADCYRQLARAGWLILQLPRVNQAAYLMRLGAARQRLPDFHEARGAFGEAETRRLLADGGFEIVEMRQVIKSAAIVAKEIFYYLSAASPRLMLLSCPLLNRITMYDELYAGEGQGLWVIARKMDG